MGQFNASFQAVMGTLNASAAQISVTDDLTFDESVSVPAAQAGSLTTRTDNTSGTLTLGAGHTIITGQRVDLYWTGGQRYGVAVGTVSGTSVPFSGGAGTNLPIATTAITVGVPQQRLVTITGDNVSGILAQCPAAGVSSYVVFASSAPANLFATLMSGTTPYYWYTGSGVTNPLAGVTVASVWISHNYTGGALAMRLATLYH